MRRNRQKKNQLTQVDKAKKEIEDTRYLESPPIYIHPEMLKKLKETFGHDIKNTGDLKK